MGDRQDVLDTQLVGKVVEDKAYGFYLLTPSANSIIQVSFPFGKFISLNPSFLFKRIGILIFPFPGYS